MQLKNLALRLPLPEKPLKNHTVLHEKNFNVLANISSFCISMMVRQRALPWYHTYVVQHVALVVSVS
jgi:hypothetical protein